VQVSEVKHIEKAVSVPGINVNKGRQENKTTQLSTRESPQTCGI